MWNLTKQNKNLTSTNLDLTKVAKERPSDPIQYVADYLHGIKPEVIDSSPKKLTNSLPSSPTKSPDQIEEQNFTNVDENGTAEENGHQSRLDDFKVQGQIKGDMGKRRKQLIIENFQGKTGKTKKNRK